MDLHEALSEIERFLTGTPRDRLADIEYALQGKTVASLTDDLAKYSATKETLRATAVMKRAAGQINVTIHALGILLCLPHLLEQGEIIESLSLGAGSTGKRFDLETDRRIAEFKFIHWRGGPEAIRQNSLFKDLYGLAEYPTAKSRYLYVLRPTVPLRFLNGNRSLKSVLTGHAELRQRFFDKFGGQYTAVGEYFREKGSSVHVQDVSEFVPGLLLIDGR